MNEAQSTEINEEVKAVEGEIASEQFEGGTIGETQSAEHIEQGETFVAPVVQVAMGIGQFVRHVLVTNQTKSNTDVLALVHKVFPEAKTTMACIAWYKTDLRKKGLLQAGGVRGSTKTVELSAEQLAELCK